LDVSASGHVNRKALMALRSSPRPANCTFLGFSTLHQTLALKRRIVSMLGKHGCGYDVSQGASHSSALQMAYHIQQQTVEEPFIACCDIRWGASPLEQFQNALMLSSSR
jgi:hypothetical protein